VVGDVCEGGYTPPVLELPCPREYGSIHPHAWNVIYVFLVCILLLLVRGLATGDIKAPGGAAG